jgi:hypothetical protein
MGRIVRWTAAENGWGRVAVDHAIGSHLGLVVEHKRRFVVRPMVTSWSVDNRWRAFRAAWDPGWILGMLDGRLSGASARYWRCDVGYALFWNGVPWYRL